MVCGILGGLEGQQIKVSRPKRSHLCRRSNRQSIPIAQRIYNSSRVQTIVETGPRNSRFIFASCLINAPPEAAWAALTNYEQLHTFIPGLTVNKCLQRTPTGARLLQIGQQDIALGIKFAARCILDVVEHPRGLSQASCVSSLSSLDNVISSKQQDERGLFPLPRNTPPGTRHSDISFELVEGDFLVFRGLWRVQEQQQRDDSNKRYSQLSYTLFVRPHSWLPVGLIQGRVQREVVANLEAVKRFVEQRQDQLVLQLSDINTESSNSFSD